MPAQYGQLARDGDRRNLVTASGPDAQKESAQWTRCLGRSPRRFDEHRASMRSPTLADPAVLGKPEAGLPHPWIESDIADQLFGIGKAPHIPDRGHQARRHNQVDAGDREEALDCRIVDGRLRDLLIEDRQIFA
jgi:hypothetical protein